MPCQVWRPKGQWRMRSRVRATETGGGENRRAPLPRATERAEKERRGERSGKNDGDDGRATRTQTPIDLGARPAASEPVAAMLVRLGVRSAAAPSAPAAPSPPPPPPPEAAAAAPTAEEETAAEQDGGGDVRMGAAPPPPQTEADEDPLLAPPREQHAQRARRGTTVANYATLANGR